MLGRLEVEASTAAEKGVNGWRGACRDDSGRREGELLGCRNTKDAVSNCCSSDGVVSACSPRIRDPPICGREREKRSSPCTWAPLEDWTRSLLTRPSSVESDKRDGEGMEKVTVSVC